MIPCTKNKLILTKESSLRRGFKMIVHWLSYHRKVLLDNYLENSEDLTAQPATLSKALLTQHCCNHHLPYLDLDQHLKNSAIPKLTLQFMTLWMAVVFSCDSRPYFSCVWERFQVSPLFRLGKNLGFIHIISGKDLLTTVSFTVIRSGVGALFSIGVWLFLRVSASPSCPFPATCVHFREIIWIDKVGLVYWF